MTSIEAAPGGLRLSTAQGKWVVVSTVLGSSVVMLEGTVVNIALPRLGDDLDADFAGLQWVLNGYMLALASLILVGGSLGDRFGRRRVFVIGVAWFAAASLFCALAPSLPFLVAARVLQGVGGALLTPGSLAIIQASFHPDDRARAIGAWSGLGGIGAAIGPLLGGWLVGTVSWPWIFLINLPLCVVVMVVAVRHIPESRDPTASAGPDLPGAVLGAIGLAGVTYGLIEQLPAAAIVGAVAFIAFGIAEAQERDPMLPLSIFANRQFTAANLVTVGVYSSLSMLLFLLALVLQETLGYEPIQAGLATLPITAVMLVFSARSGSLARRIGPRIPMTVGPLLIAAGLALMVRVGAGATYVGAVLPALLVFSAGLAFTVAPLTSTVLAAADNRHAGLASGVNNAVSRVAGLVAVAAVPLVAGFDPGAAVSSRALETGFHRAAIVAAGLAATAGVIAAAAIRSDVLVEDESVDDDDQQGTAGEADCFHCGVDSAPLVGAGRRS